MSDTNIKIGLDPRAAKDGLAEISKGAKELSKAIEDSLGKKAPKDVEKLEDAAERGSNKISNIFRNLGSRIKEDLKTAFDLGAVTQGLNFAKSFNEGVKEVFSLEKAFDRLNTRLGLSASNLLEFRKNLGRAVAGTGQKTEDILPGVETASSKGGIKDAKQLADIAKYLGQAKAINSNENVNGLSEDVIEILKKQNKNVNAANFKATLDAIEGTRAAGGFNTAGEAASAIKELAPYAQKLGIGTRDLGGLAANASKSGESGQNILAQLLHAGTTIGGQQTINAALGQNVFNKGKLDVEALKKVNTERFGKESQQVLEQTTGLTGANGGDLKRFIDSFKSGTQQLDQVTKGADETGSQFQVASKNLGFQFDKFKQEVINSANEVGGALSSAGNALLHGDFKGAGEAGKAALNSALENKGTLLGAGALTLGTAVLAGGGLRGLLGKVGGGVVAGEAAKAAGIQPVYVVNAAEIGGGETGGLISKIGKIGGAGALGVLGSAGGVAAAGVAGFAVGELINKVTGNTGQLGGKLYDFLHPSEVQASIPGASDPAVMKKAIVDGVVEGHVKAKGAQPTILTNPSDRSGNRGRHQ